MKMKRLFLLLTLTATLSAFSKKTAEVMTTRADSQVLLKTEQFKIGSAFGTANSIITLDAKQKYQTMDGFGFALTYSACYNLMKMTPQDRHDLLVKTFSPTDGFGVNYVRMSIACSDFSSECYTYCEKKGPEDNLLANFTLHDDEISYVIPIMKEVLAINPKITLDGSPLDEAEKCYRCFSLGLLRRRCAEPDILRGIRTVLCKIRPDNEDLRY